jgi:Glycosyl transferases group 1
MNSTSIHIICFLVPYPIDHGGKFDLFYKIVALKAAGVKIHLHCYLYDNQVEQAILNDYCETVTYYKRSKKISFTLPYIVSSRVNEDLCKNLLKDDFSIIIEGVHSSFIVFDKRFSRRKIYLRAHNVEHLYYQGLAKSAGWGFKKIYYWIESQLLKKYERRLAYSLPIITVSQSDYEYFEIEHKAKWASYLPVFFNGHFNMPLGNGSFCVYHGNLSVQENEEAVTWLLENVFNDIEIPFVIAGKNPSQKLIDLSHQYMHTCIAINPSDAEMKDLVQKAQINILPSINATGVKLKLLNSLYNGRFCMTNIKGANGFDNKDLFIHADDAAAMKQLIVYYFTIPFTENEAQLRKEILNTKYDLVTNANRLLKLLHLHYPAQRPQ